MDANRHLYFSFSEKYIVFFLFGKQQGHLNFSFSMANFSIDAYNLIQELIQNVNLIPKEKEKIGVVQFQEL